jgi:tRNA A-37 threonylcarbamoyl transferase component Bud32
MEKLTLHIKESCIDLPESRTEISLQETLREVPTKRIVQKGRWKDNCVVIKRYLSDPKQDCIREWKKTKKLAETPGLNIPKPLFFGEDARGKQLIVTRYVEKTVTLKHFFEHPHTLAERITVLRLFLKTLATCHNYGMYQNDLHFENFLWDGKSLFILDAGSFKFKKAPLRFSLRIKNLSWVFANISLFYNQDLWRSYEIYQESCYPNNLTQALQKQIPKTREKRLTKYLKKTTRSCSAFITENLENKKFFIRQRTLSESLQNAFKNNPDQLINEGKIIKAGNTCTVSELTWKKKDYIIKRYNKRPFLYRLTHCFTKSRAKKTWSNGLTWSLFGLPTPQPLACLEEKQLGLIKRSFILMEKEPGLPLDEFVQKHKHEPATLVSLFENFYKIWKLIPLLRASQRDMKATNFIVSENTSISFIDLDDLHFFSPSALYKKRREKDIKRFKQNWQKYPKVLEVFHEAIDKVEKYDAKFDPKNISLVQYMYTNPDYNTNART